MLVSVARCARSRSSVPRLLCQMTPTPQESNSSSTNPLDSDFIARRGAMGFLWFKGRPPPPPPPPPPLAALLLAVRAEAHARGIMGELLVVAMFIALVGALVLLKRALVSKPTKRRRSTISSKMTNRVDTYDEKGDPVMGRRKAVRGGVAAKVVSSAEKKRAEEAKQKEPKEAAWIKKAIRKNEIFHNLKDDQLDEIVGEAKAQLATTGQAVIVQDALEETFYVVGSGTYEVTRDGKVVASTADAEDQLRAAGHSDGLVRLLVLRLDRI